MSRARGVDVSAVQAYCDWAAFKAGGFEFAIVKATEGGRGVDAFFQSHYFGATAAGVLVPLAYHVLTWGSSVEDQVSNTLQTLGAFDIAGVLLDFEVDSAVVPAREKVQRALNYTAQLLEHGLRVVVYSYPDYERRLEDVPELAGLAAIAPYLPAWYPHQKVEPTDREIPQVPRAWGGRWWGWQWSGDGGLDAPGIPQVVDHDVFNGTRDELVAWMKGDKAETAPAPGDTSGPAA